MWFEIWKGRKKVCQKADLGYDTRFTICATGADD